MIRELTGRLKAWAGKTVAALREKLAAAARTIRPTLPAVACARAVIGVPERNLLETGMQLPYQLTSGHPHAPVFSLFTFFADRQ